MGLPTEEESPQLESGLQPRTEADEDIPSCRDKKYTYGPHELTGCDTDSPSGELSEIFDRPVTESVTARAGSDTDFPSDEHSELVDRPVTESVTARAGSDTVFPSDEHSEFFDRPVTESVTARATNTFEILFVNVSTVVTEQSELREMGLCETDKRGIPVYREKCVPESQRPGNTSPDALQRMKMSNYQCHCVDYCIGVCGKAESVNCPETGSCWNCCCLICQGYCVSCLVAIVIKDRFYGIELFTEGRCVFTRGPGLVGNPVRPCDAIQVYTKMKEKFTGVMDMVMMRNKDPVDSRRLQRCADNGHRSLALTSGKGKPIREKGWFGCVDNPAFLRC